ncbi:MAG: ParA family protein [Coriobacteriia bacterium]|nr:ParA family protein [Coriobacteriia bacterium]MCL2750133.1 ParA family protein [Coriobacteriia bacterium]
MEKQSNFYEKHALLVILGHYGSGKTNLSLNLAKRLKALGRSPVLVDLDVVNPYFRSTDYRELMEAEGVRVLGPVFGGSASDLPSLAPGIEVVIENATLAQPVILDVGGDPDGARALVRYTPFINKIENKLVLIVVNTRRPETQSSEGNLRIISEIAQTTSLSIDGLVGNTHLAEFTTMETIEQSLPLMLEISKSTKIPLVAITTPEELAKPLDEQQIYLPVERLVKTNWQ